MEFGLFILDISDPSLIVEKSNYTPNPDYPIVDPEGPEVPNVRGMDIKGNHLFICYDAGGIRVIDVTDKEHPDEIGKFLNDTNQNFTPKAYNNIIIQDNIAFVAVDYCGFEILNIADVNDIKMIGWWNPWNCDSLSNIWWNSPGHSNQMTFVAEENLMFIATGRSELSVIDVADLSDPILANSYGDSSDTLATWGMALHNQDIYLLYISASVPLYSNWSGLKKLTWSFE